MYICIFSAWGIILYIKGTYNYVFVSSSHSYTCPYQIVLQYDLENLKVDLITIYASCKYT